MTPVEIRVNVVNQMGMHARPAAAFVTLAGEFASAITLEKDGLEVNGKSIMGVLMLAAEHGSELIIRCTGGDAADAAAALNKLVLSGFDEE